LFIFPILSSPWQDLVGVEGLSALREQLMDMKETLLETCVGELRNAILLSNVDISAAAAGEGSGRGRGSGPDGGYHSGGGSDSDDEVTADNRYTLRTAHYICMLNYCMLFSPIAVDSQSFAIDP
jgi:hypothetical protein